MGKNTQLLRLHLLSTVPTSYLSLLKLHRVLDSQSWSLNFTKTWDGNTSGDPLQERLLKWRLRRGWGRWASRSCGGATKAAFSAHVHQASNWREIWGCILKMPVLASTKKWNRVNLPKPNKWECPQCIIELPVTPDSVDPAFYSLISLITNILPK